MKKNKSPLLFILLLFLFISTSIYAKDTTYFKYGNGTAEEPWLISNLDDMYNLCLHSEIWSDYFKVTNDIDLSDSKNWFDGAGYMPIGKSSLTDTIIPFSGNFDGGGYELSNLAIQAGKQDYIGLFAYAENANLANIKLTNLTINNGDAYIGAIVGFGEHTNIENCHTEGHTNGIYDVGGIIGYCNYGQISECSSTCFINGEAEIGGLVGTLRYSNIRDCFFAGVSRGNKNIAGICGLMQYSEIIDSYSKGVVFAEKSGAGIVGYAGNSYLKRCYVSGYIENTVDKNNTFAIIANNENSNFENCYWDLQTTTSTQADPDNSNIATGLSTTDMMLKSTYSNWNFGVHWRIKDEQSRPFLQWETVNINNGSYLHKKIDYAFCSVSDIADEKIAELGMIICDSLDIFTKQYTKHSFNTTAVELNSNRFIDEQIIDGLEFGKIYWACAYAETPSGKLFLGDRIKIIGDNTDTTAVFDDIANSSDSFQMMQSSSIFLINIDVTVKKSELKIFDVLGKEVFSQDISVNRLISIDLSSFTSGMYFCSLFSNNTIKTKAFIYSN